jgi:predicted esterase
VAQELKVETIRTQITGRYLVRPARSTNPAPMLVGFHGYGENPKHHLDELLSIPGLENWLLVSVSALHRFYERKTGTVVGSWMTSEDREHLILDNLRYVDTVVDSVSRTHSTSATVVYSGFSQGSAMAYRAGLRGRIPAAGIIALGSDIPPELQTSEHADWPKVLLGRGTTDPWYTEEQMDRDVTFLRSASASLDTVVFEGGHEWHDDFRKAAARFLRTTQT